MAFIRKVKTSSGATAVQIARKRAGKIVEIIHLGSAHSRGELEVLLSLARKRLQENQLPLFPSPPTSSFKVEIKRSVSRLLFETLQREYRRLGFGKLADDDFCRLVIARIVEPTSKLDSLRVLADMGVDGVSKDRLYRCLARAADGDYRETIARRCSNHAKRQGLTLVLYDVTSLYFEITEEDDYRKPGLSKERRLDPQIIVGLLVDQNGFPLGLESFEGNTAETTTLLPVLNRYRLIHRLTAVTVVADAGMLSLRNLAAIADAGHHFIVGSRLTKTPYGLAEYQEKGPLTDGQTIVTGKAGQRIIYQYRSKRAALDLRNIEKQLVKAQRIIAGRAPLKRNRFVSLNPQGKKLNQAMIAKDRALAGIKGYITDLTVDPAAVINYYHQLFQVEATFRMAKSDLKARPIFHHKRKAIEAHLTIVLAGLAISRKIERQTGVSIKRFVNSLRPVRSGTVRLNGKNYAATAVIPEDIQLLLDKLRSGH